MRRCGVSFDDAAKIVTVSYSFSAAMSTLNLSPMDAIHHLTSKLNVENLLLSIEDTLKSQEQETTQSSQLTNFVQSLPTLKATENTFIVPNSSYRQLHGPPLKPTKTKVSSRLDSAPKISSKTQTQEVPTTNATSQETVEGNSEDLDAQIAEKELNMSEQVAVTMDPNSQKVKASSPAVSSVRTKRLCNREGNETQNQPPLKRPRTESV